MTITPQVVELSAREFAEARDEIVEVYRVAFAQDNYPHPQNEGSRLAGVLADHSQRAGFRGRAVREQPSGPVRGIAYGYTSSQGQWWHDVVVGALPTEARERWLGDCFEVVELHLMPWLQGRGLGGRLHDSLLDGLPHRSAALSTLTRETPAQLMYKKRGWVTLLENFSFPGGTKPFSIMGLDLNDRRSS